MKPRDITSGLTYQELVRLLSYDPETGVFRWRSKRRPRVQAGDIAGTLTRFGYGQIEINHHIYRSHRLAWLYFYGEWPKSEIDHQNGIKDDNRISNLREATHAENSRNRPAQRNNTSGHKGIAPCGRRWVARIHLNGKTTYLGLYKTVAEAVAVRKKAEKEMFGDFA